MDFRQTASPRLLMCVLLLTGCSQDTEPDESKQRQLPSASIPSSQAAPSAPPYRLFDVAADYELRFVFAGNREEQDEARQKYASQRWRFRAKVGFKDEHYAVVHPEGSEPVFVYFRTSEEAASIHLNEEHLFEATVDDWVSRYFKDGVVIHEGKP